MLNVGSTVAASNVILTPYKSRRRQMCRFMNCSWTLRAFSYSSSSSSKISLSSCVCLSHIASVIRCLRRSRTSFPVFVERCSPPRLRLNVFSHRVLVWFEEMKDLRDDVLTEPHLTKKRVVTFPDLVDVLRAGGGQSSFT